MVGGKMLPGDLQEVSGIEPGQQVVANALVLQWTAQEGIGGEPNPGAEKSGRAK